MIDYMGRELKKGDLVIPFRNVNKLNVESIFGIVVGENEVFLVEKNGIHYNFITIEDKNTILVNKEELGGLAEIVYNKLVSEYNKYCMRKLSVVKIETSKLECGQVFEKVEKGERCYYLYLGSLSLNVTGRCLNLRSTWNLNETIPVDRVITGKRVYLCFRDGYEIKKNRYEKFKSLIESETDFKFKDLMFSPELYQNTNNYLISDERLVFGNTVIRDLSYVKTINLDIRNKDTFELNYRNKKNGEFTWLCQNSQFGYIDYCKLTFKRI